MFRIVTLALLLALSCPKVASADSSGRFVGGNARPADAVEIFTCGFDKPWDVNYDGWPDRWSREEGPGYPKYVQIGIEEDKGTKSQRRLSIRLDGSQAIVSSPPIRVMPKFGYFLELKLRRTQVRKTRVTVRMDYLDKENNIRQSFYPKRYGETEGWTRICIGPVRPKYDDIDRAIIRVEAERTDRGDLKGVVSIADLWIGRTPSLDVMANNRYHVYTNPRDVEITCSLSGIRERDPDIRFQLLDATSHLLGDKSTTRLDGQEIPEQKLIHEERRRASDIVDGIGNHAAGFEGSTTWRPDILNNGKYGFFQVRVDMLSSETGEQIDSRTITLAVIPDAIAKRSTGEFGWTLPTADKPLDFAALEKLLPLLGVNWVKLPIWFPEDDPERGDEIINFAERLAASDIELVGVLQHPDDLIGEDLDDEDHGPREVANLFSGDSSHWLPLFDHIMTRLSLRIRWWQLGADHDTSFVGYANLVQQISDIRHRLYRFGQDVGLGLGWRWDTPLQSGFTSWEFNQMASNPPLTVEELEERLSQLPTVSGKRWVLIEPTPADPAITDPDEQHVARLRGFIEQIVIAKRYGADGLFISNPFSGPYGLMTADGKPGSLLLPWRTSATLLNGAKYLGQLQLPSGSPNWLFRREDGEVVMVTWNDKPVNEVLYLGDRVKVVDVWGKSTFPQKEGYRDVIPVTRTPKFVIGLNEAVARWRMSVRFENERVPSVFSVEHPNALLMKNGFDQGVGGKMSLYVPDRLRQERGLPPRQSNDWGIDLPTEQFTIGSMNEHTMQMVVNIDDAAIGRQPIRIDFEVSADRVEEVYRFSVWRSLEVGAGEVDVDFTTEMGPRGQLLIHQEMSNSGGNPISFKCTLNAPPRKRKRTQVFQLGPEADTKTYVYGNGGEMIGRELTFRAVEIDGPRVLVKRFVARE